MAKSKFQKSYKDISGRRKYRAKSSKYGFFFFLLRLARRHVKALSLSIFAISIAGGIFYFLFISGEFQIREITISGLERVSEEEVLDAVGNILGEGDLQFLKSRNYFLFPEEKLSSFLYASFPKIGEIEIKKSQYNGANISIEEREAMGVWCKSDDCFYFDKKGVIFEPAVRSFGALIIGVEDSRDIEPSLGSMVLGESQIISIEKAHSLIGRNFPFGIRTFFISKEGGYEILTSENWRILLDKNETLEYQLSNLKYLLDEEIKTRRLDLEYVDLRLGNRVYYRYEGAETID